LKNSTPVIILAGQLYLDEEKNTYLIVTKTKGEVISYQAPGFKGQLEVEVFLDRFLPVDPTDVSVDEISGLLEFCQPGIHARVGFIKD
jgi:hypothetical protein